MSDVERPVLPRHSVPLPWQQQQWRQLQVLLASARLPHALLLHGPDGIGKRQFAQALVRLLLCAKPGEAGNCGRCHACDLSRVGNHPDWYALGPDGKAGRIRIDPVRELCRALAGTAQLSGNKAAVVASAELFNTNAANALLKTLEEPPPNTYLILLSHRPRLLAATVRSRCQAVAFGLPPVELAVDWLVAQGIALEPAAAALSVASGRPLRAAEWLQGGQLEQLLAFRTAGQRWLAGEVSSSDMEGFVDNLSWAELLAELRALLLAPLRTTGRTSLAPGVAAAAFRLLDELCDIQRQTETGGSINRRLLLASLLPRLRRVLQVLSTPAQLLSR